MITSLSGRMYTKILSVFQRYQPTFGKRNVEQELSCCSDGPAMLHKSNFFAFEWRYLCLATPSKYRNLLEYYHESYVVKNIFSGIKFYCRRYGSNFNHCDGDGLIASKYTSSSAIAERPRCISFGLKVKDDILQTI